MKIIKLIPFYLLLTLNFLVAIILIIDYPSTINDQGMMWGAEPMGWQYENKTNYTVLILITLIILIVPSVYALKKLKTNKKQAYLVAAIPFFIYVGIYIHYVFFFDI